MFLARTRPILCQPARHFPAPRTYPDGFCAMASTGMLGALSGASPTVPSVWRLRRDRAASRERPCRSG